MSSRRFKLVSCVSAVLLVTALLTANAGAALASTHKAKAGDKAARSATHPGKGSAGLARALGRARDAASAKALAGAIARAGSGRASTRKVGHPQALSAKVVHSLRRVTPGYKHVKAHLPKAGSMAAAALAQHNARAKRDLSAGLNAALDEQFAGLDENNDDNDPLNLGDDFSADTDGAVGPEYYGEVVGTAYGFFNKSTGALVDGDTLLDLFSGTGIGEPCDTSDLGPSATDDGYYEPHILYDSQADRWIIMITATANPDTTDIGPYDECIAVSRSGDPVNGDWYFYSVPLASAGALIPFGSATAVWTNGIYFSETLGCEDAATLCPGYNANEEFVGTQVWAFNRSDLESGAPLRVQTTQGVGGIGSGNFTGSRTTTTFSNLDADGIVPANLETSTGLPPVSRSGTGQAGNEYFMSMSDLPGSAATPQGDGLMDIWQYHVDWSNPSNSWIGQSASNQTDYQVTTPTYGVPDFSSGEITEAGPTAYSNTLDTDYDYILPKPQYTNFGGVESLWTAHATSTCSGSCNANSTTGPDRVRWNQISINSSDGSPVTAAAAQGQDYAPAPTTLNRWLPAIGVDQDGDLAVGYSGTSSTVFPSLYLAGRAASDAANTLTSLPETEIYAGDGYQTGSYDLSDVADTLITNFGPENSMSLDPNGCELWFAGQVDVGSPTQPDGSDNAWATEVSSFHFPGCSASTLATSLSASGNAGASSNTGTLTATLTANGTGSGVVGEPVAFTLGGNPVGTATTASNGVATLTGVDTSAYSAGTNAGAVGASFAGDAGYNYGTSSASGSLLVGNTQTISFGALGNQTYGNAAFTVSATASSGLPVSFSASGDDGQGDGDSGTCSVSGSTVTITGAGICTITASQAGDGSTWLPAAPVSQTFDIAPEPQTITVTGTWSTTNQSVGTSFKASATASGGGTVYFTSDEVNCTELDNGDTPQDTFVPLHTGTCTIYANQDGSSPNQTQSSNYAPVSLPVPVSVTGLGTLTGSIAVTSTSRRVDQLQNTPDDVTWNETVNSNNVFPSGLTDSSYTTSGTATAGSVAASSALSISAAANAINVATSGSWGITAGAAGGSGSSRTETITCGTGCGSGVIVGNQVVIAGNAVANYNRTAVVSAATATTLTVGSGSTNVGTWTAGGTPTVAISGASESGTTVTINTATAHGLTTGAAIVVAGVGTGYNGPWTIASTPLGQGAAQSTAADLTYTASASSLSPASGGTVTPANSGATQSGNEVTITTTASNAGKINAGDQVSVQGVGVAGYNGTYTVDAVPTTTTFTYNDTNGSNMAASGGGTAADTSITGASETGNTVTLNLTAAPSATLTPGVTQITVSGVTPSTYNGSYTVTAVPSSTSVQYSDPTTPIVAGGGGTIAAPANTCTASGSLGSELLTALAPGTCTVTATFAGNADFNPATLTKSYTITAGTQSVTWSPAGGNISDSSNTNVSVTTNSALSPGTVTATTPSTCSVGSTTTAGGTSSVTVTPGADGTCTLSAAGNSGSSQWSTLAAKTQNFTVTSIGTAQTITFTAPASQSLAVTPVTLSATATSGMPVSFSSSTTSVCTTTGSNGATLNLLTAGTCTVVASQAGGSGYAPATSVTRSFAVNMADQLIEFTQLPDVNYPAADFELTGSLAAVSVTAYYSSEVPQGTPTGLAVGYAASGRCSVYQDVSNNWWVHITGAGTCTVTASQAGNSVYNPAPSVANVFTVDRGASTITFPAIPAQTYGNSDITPGASVNSGEAVTYTSSGQCSIVAGPSIHLTGAGSCTVTAHSVGDANYGPPAAVSHTFSIAQAVPTVTVTDPAPTTGPVTYNVNVSTVGNAETPTGSVSVSDGQGGTCSIASLDANGDGSCSIVENASGSPFSVTATYNPTDANYASASGALTEHVNPATPTVSIIPSANPASPGPVSYAVSVSGAGATPTGSVSVDDGQGGTCSIASLDANGDGSCSIDESAAANPYTVTASFHSGDGNYTDASAQISESVNANTPTMTITPSASPATTGAVSYQISVSGSGPTPTGDVSVSDGQGGTCSIVPMTDWSSPQSCSIVENASGSPYTVTATYGGDFNYSSTSVSVSEVVNPATPTVTITPSHNPATTGSVTYNIQVSGGGATPTGTVTVGDGQGGNCTTGNLVAGAGSCSIFELASQSPYTVTASFTTADGNYTNASASITETVNKANQTITFPTIPNHTYGNADFTVTATASSGLQVTYEASGPCQINNSGVVHITGAGTCTITAFQAGDGDYNRATSVHQSFTINPAPTKTMLKVTPTVVHLSGAHTVTLKATISFNPAIAGQKPSGSVVFTIGSGMNSQTTGPIAVNSHGVATTSLVVTLPAQTARYPVNATYTSNNTNYAGSSNATPKKLKVKS